MFVLYLFLKMGHKFRERERGRDSSGDHVKRVTKELLMAELVWGEMNSAHAPPVQLRAKFWREDTR